jgi:hypothetical protein
MLDELACCCAELGLTVAVSKTQWVRISNGAAVPDNPAPVFLYHGMRMAIERVPLFKYLGSPISKGSGGARLTDEKRWLLEKMRRAMFSVMGKVRCLRAGLAIHEAVAVFEAFAVGAVTFGCEAIPLRNRFWAEADRLQAQFVRWLLGRRMRSALPIEPLLAEVGLRPLRWVVAERRLAFISAVWGRERSCPTRQLLAELVQAGACMARWRAP